MILRFCSQDYNGLKNSGFSCVERLGISLGKLVREDRTKEIIRVKRWAKWAVAWSLRWVTMPDAFGSALFQPNDSGTFLWETGREVLSVKVRRYYNLANNIPGIASCGLLPTADKTSCVTLPWHLLALLTVGVFSSPVLGCQQMAIGHVKEIWQRIRRDGRDANSTRPDVWALEAPQTKIQMLKINHHITGRIARLHSTNLNSF